jgi:hypothetical protein
VPSRVPVIGHLYQILTSGAVWDLFADWILTYGWTLRFPMWNETVILTADVPFVKRIMNQTSLYHKVVNVIAIMVENGVVILVFL